MTTVLRSRELAIVLVLVAVIAAATIKTRSFLFSSEQLARPAAHPVDPDPARGRPGGRDHHPQRRPVGRLGPRPDGVPHRHGSSSTTPASRSSPCSSSASLSAPCCGLVNGLLVAFGRVPALVITLGTLYIYRGIVLTWAGSNRINAADLPDGFLALGTAAVLVDPRADLIAAGRARRRRLLPAHQPRRPGALRDRLRPRRRRALRPPRPPPRPRRVRRSAARSPVWPGSLFAARFGTVDSGAGTGFELQAVAAVVVGGVAIFGGSGTVWGAALGAVLLRHHQPARCRPRHPGLLAAGRGRRADPRRDRPRPGAVDPPGTPARSRRGTTVMSTSRTYAATTHHGHLLAAAAAHPRGRGHRAAAGRGRLRHRSACRTSPAR